MVLLVLQHENLLAITNNYVNVPKLIFSNLRS